MRDDMRLEGKYIVLEEISPKYFKYVIDWRNDPELNKFLNQPFKLTMELEQNWYENKYLKDDTQGLWVILDKATNTPVGTVGWTDFDYANKRLIGGRLLFGDEKFTRHPGFLESHFLHADYLYKFADIEYAHIVAENHKAIHLNEITGFAINTGKIQYPNELFVNGMKQIEFYRTKEMYLEARKKVFERIFKRRM